MYSQLSHSETASCLLIEGGTCVSSDIGYPQHMTTHLLRCLCLHALLY